MVVFAASVEHSVAAFVATAAHVATAVAFEAAAVSVLQDIDSVELVIVVSLPASQ